MAGQAQLSARDKEKLKEKLALLRREYRKTFSRLQRAERAEKVKSYVKKTVAEQNSLLLQEEGPADPTGQTASEGIPAGPCSETSAVKTPSVTFSLEPEVFGREGHSPEHLGSECTAEEHGRILGGTAQPVPGVKSSRLSRSRRRGRPSVASEGGRDVACEGDRPGHEGAGQEGPQSPVFTGHGSCLEPEPSMPKAPSVITAERGGSPAPPVTPPLGDLQGPLGENVVPGVLGPPPGHLLGERWGPSLEHPREEGTVAPSEGSVVKDVVLLPDAQNVSAEKEREREDEEDLGGTASQEGGSETPQERSPFGEPRGSGHCNSDSPAVEPGKVGSGSEAEAASPLREGVSPAADSLRDSCTVVEGLLFPVEYYVRTTRRMSRCQQEPNLDAVIQSQLGTRRRRRRSQWDSPKERVAGPAPPSRGLLASPPTASQGSGGGSPLASEEQAEGVPQSGGPARRSGRGRRTGRGRPGHSPPGRGAREPLASVGSKGKSGLTSSEACRSEPQEPAGDRGRARGQPAQRATVSLQPNESPSTSLEHRAGRMSPPGGRGSRPCVAAAEPPPLGGLGLPGRLQWLPSDWAPQEFCLPAEEFGLLQSEKIRASAPRAPEVAEAAGESVGHFRGADDASLGAAGERLGDALLSPEGQPPEPLALLTSSLLLSPAHAALEGGSPLPESLPPTLLFPLVGATPATQEFCGPLRHGPAGSPREPSARAAGQVACGTEDEQCHTGASRPEDKGGACQQPNEAAAVSLEAGEELAVERREELCRASADQHDAAAEEGLAQAPRGRQGDGTLQMTSKVKNPAGSRSVDVSTVWWEFTADFTALCIVTACKASVTLWRRLDSGCWEAVHTWSFAEVPVFQLVPLPGAHSLVCVALGGPEIVELRLLFHSLQDGCLKQSPVKAGKIEAVLGLSGRRLVSSCDGAVEVLSVPDAGGCRRRQSLFPPEETTLAFAAVDGMAEALVGLTASNSVLVWNLSTGQLLCRMPLGYASPAPVCHQAYSDSGLLFVVLSHPRAQEDEACGGSAFQVVAFNPRTGRSASVMVVPLPPGLQGRYLEGDVRDTSAAAVLTSGAIAVWDLLGGECTALLPPSAEGSWSLVRWSVTDKCLLASQMDGTICIYSYATRPCSAPETAEQDGGSSFSARDCWRLAKAAAGPTGTSLAPCQLR